MLRVGVLGGTFDPIHVGHVLLAVHMRERLPLDRVLFVPAALPPHKPPRADMSAAADRWEMVRRAIAAVPGLDACRIELDRPGPSYTADSLVELKAAHPRWELFLVIGEDNIGQIAAWYRPDLIMANCTVVAGTRAGSGPPAALGDPWSGRVMRVETPTFEVSSTEVRRRVRLGLPVRYLVPESVEEYIRERGLYQSGESQSAPRP